MQQTSTDLEQVDFDELESKPKRLRITISSCSTSFEDKNREHECEEAEFILLCIIHNKLNCYRFQFTVYLPSDRYVNFLELETETEMRSCEMFPCSCEQISSRAEVWQLQIQVL